MAATIGVTCSCGRTLRFPADRLGARGRCPSCGATVEAPRPAPGYRPYDAPPAEDLRVARRKVRELTLEARYRHGQHSHPEFLDRAAEGLLETTAGFDGQGPGLADGVTVTVGLMTLTLKSLGGALVLCEPDFGKDPFSDVLPDVTFTLQWMVMQALVSELVTEPFEPVECRFRDAALVARGALAEEWVSMHRYEEPSENVSGWFIGFLDRERAMRAKEEEDFEPVPLFEIARLRPHLLKVVCLPVDSLVLFRGDEVVDVSGPGGASWWPEEARQPLPDEAADEPDAPIELAPGPLAPPSARTTAAEPPDWARVGFLDRLASTLGLDRFRRVDPTHGEPTARRLAAAAARGDWREISRFLDSVRDWDHRHHRVDQIAETPGRPAWLDEWVAAGEADATAWLVRGAHSIRWAWQARGSGPASSVTEEGWRLFFERLRLAEDDLERAAGLAPADPTPLAFRIVTARGLQLGEAETLSRLGEVRRRFAEHRSAHEMALVQLARKWGGSHERMFEFARAVRRDAPRGSPLHALIVEAHLLRMEYDLWFDEVPGALAYFADPAVGEEIVDAYRACLDDPNARRIPQTVEDRNRFAFCFVRMGARDLARKEFAAIGKRITEFPWIYLGSPVTIFNALRRIY